MSVKVISYASRKPISSNRSLFFDIPHFRFPRDAFKIKRKKRYVLFNVIVGLALGGCVSGSPKQPYRLPTSLTEISDPASDCNQDIPNIINRTNLSGKQPPQDLDRHALQRNLLNVNGDNVCFDLGYLEFNENGQLIDASQLTNIQNRLINNVELGATNYVIAFVHGWRNDASLGRIDVTKNALVAAYLTSFINQRCMKGGTGKKCAVTSIYVGWPGRVIKEPPVPGIDLATAAPTFPRARRIGDEIGANVVNLLDKKLLNDDYLGKSGRSIVIGHSAGANLLMAGLIGGNISESPIGRSIRAYNEERLKAVERENLEPTAPSENVNLISPLGDMVVLINPASPAKRWLDLQRYSFVKRGEKSEKISENDKLGVLMPRGENTGRLQFNKKQKPTLLAVTSACGVDTNGKRIPLLFSSTCDRATSIAFNLSQTLLSGKIDKEERYAIGHYVTKVEKRKKDSSEANLGISHEISDSSSDKVERAPTSWASLSEIENSLCDVNGDYLYESRKKVESESGRDGDWDTADTSSELSSIVRKKQGDSSDIIIQSRFKITLTPFGRSPNKSNKGELTLQAHRVDIDSNSPFWNARGDKTAIFDHGAYVSYPFLCHMTQLWLDNR